MKVAVFVTRRYDRESFDAANVAYGHALKDFEPSLLDDTAALAAKFPAVCSFVNDKLEPPPRSQSVIGSRPCH